MRIRYAGVPYDIAKMGGPYIGLPVRTTLLHKERTMCKCCDVVQLSLRRVRALWRAMGGCVTDVRRTGEERYTHPKIPSPITVNKRRKDAPRILIVLCRRLKAAA
jgi:hypothetical protein